MDLRPFGKMETVDGVLVALDKKRDQGETEREKTKNSNR